MRLSWLAAALSAALLAGCQAQSTPFSPGGQQGWRAGPNYGPMMAYGYCPGAPSGNGGAQQGWYGPGMMGGHGGGTTGGGMMGGSGGGRMGGPMMGRGGAFDPQQATAWLDAAKTQIGVTSAQEQAWSAYADTVQADRASMYSMHAQMPTMIGNSGADAPDRLQAHLGFMQTRLASLQQVQTASWALFAVLTPDQRNRADQTLWSGCW